MTKLIIIISILIVVFCIIAFSVFLYNFCKQIEEKGLKLMLDEIWYGSFIEHNYIYESKSEEPEWINSCI